jgi:hypothetical protein
MFLVVCAGHQVESAEADVSSLQLKRYNNNNNNHHHHHHFQGAEEYPT